MYKYFSFFVVFSLLSCGLYAQKNYQSTISNYFSKNPHNLTENDYNNLDIYSNSYSKSMDLENVYAKQQANGIPVFNAVGSFAIRNNRVVNYAGHFVNNLQKKANTSTPNLTPVSAVKKVAEKLGLASENLAILQGSQNNKNFLLSTGNISQENIPVRLNYFVNEKQLNLAWNIVIHTLDDNHWWNIEVDALNGKILRQNDWIVSCVYGAPNPNNWSISHSKKTSKHVDFNPQNSMLSATDGSQYNVFARPVESPIHGDRSIVTNPADEDASPYGWHDTDGADGPEFTITRGNNVWAYGNRDAQTVGAEPDGGTSLDFDFPLNLNQDPEGYIDVAIVNLFYWNNIMHDIWYQYGFDEDSGNFQANNYGNPGIGNDAVTAKGQFAADYAPLSNASFATPPDGQGGTMNMFTWTAPVGGTSNLTVNSPADLEGDYLSTASNFGPVIPADGLTADFVLVIDDDSGASDDPNDACDVITNGSQLNGKIAVLKRGTCDFTGKVEKAQTNGAVGVIIVNDVAGNPISAGGNDPSITIPSVMVTLSAGNQIITALNNGTTVNGTLIPNGPFEKDGDLDGAIMSHEYGHGISTRLTGGASNSDCLTPCTETDSQGNCLNYTEQMGEGWSDYFALMMTMEPNDQPGDSRGIGTYVINEGPNGAGIRPSPYSTDFSINDFTYGDTNNQNVILETHGIGFVWATMLWDLAWDLIDEHGYDPDIYHGTGGNNIAMQLVIDGIKLQICNPGFVDGRDAILQADMEDYNGENQCLIWQAFADRGLGYSADEGDPLSRFDQTEAFDMPPEDVLYCSMGSKRYGTKLFKVYPNPANGIVNISALKTTQGEATLNLYDLNGRKLMSKTVKSSVENTINVSDFSSGVYILKINTGRHTQTEKLIVK